MAPTMSLPSRTELAALVRPLMTWKFGAVLFALMNLKALPLGWHVRILKHFVLNTHFTSPPLNTLASPAQTHPIFTPTTITSYTPILEIDYNLHKSNSTYFSDLDVSRSALVTKLYIKGCGILNKRLTKEEGKQGRLTVILGSVYTSFKREILPYQRYEISSKVAGWDDKWLYIITFFQKPASKKNKNVKDDSSAAASIHSKRLLAMSISKYVVKKGRWTVAPEAVLTASGLMPEKPASMGPVASTSLSSGVATPSGRPEMGSRMATATDGLTAANITDADSTFLEAGESVVLVATGGVEDGESGDVSAGSSDGAEVHESPSTQAAKAGLEWSWMKIDEERKRGLEVVMPYVEVDQGLMGEFERLA